MGSGAKPPEAGEFSRIFVLKVTLQTLTVSYRKESGKQDVLPNFIGGAAAPLPPVPVPMLISKGDGFTFDAGGIWGFIEWGLFGRMSLLSTSQ